MGGLCTIFSITVIMREIRGNLGHFLKIDLYPDPKSHFCYNTNFQNDPLNHTIDGIAALLIDGIAALSSLKLFSTSVWITVILV